MMNEFLTLLPFLREHYRRYLLGVACVLAVDFLQMLIPRLLGLFTDALLLSPVHTGQLRFYLYLIVAIAAAMAFSRYLWRLYIMGTAQLLEQYLRNLLFQHLQKLPPAFYLRHRTGELMAHLTNDINAVRNSLGISIVLLVDAVFLTAMAVFFMVTTVGYGLTLLALIPLPLLAVSFKKLGTAIYQRFLGVQESFGTLTETVKENISGIRLVKAFALEDTEKERFSAAAADYMQKNFHLYRAWGLYNPLAFFFALLSFMIVVIVGGRMVMEGRISTGDFVAFNGYVVLLAWPMMAAGWVVNFLQRGRASMERINRLLQEEEAAAEGGRPALDPATVQGDLRLEQLTFRYEGAPGDALRDLSFTIPRGKITVLTGQIGSGKSTLLYLLLRFFTPQKGQIFLGEHPLESFSLSAWRSSIGYLPQDGFIFAGSIAANISFARPNATREEIAEVARLAALDTEIASFPDAYDTPVGERGITLSGGQQQRLSLARALLPRPAFLFLDDPFSAVDLATAEKITANLAGLKDTTIVLVSHRLQTFKQAHKIIVLEKGRLAAEGTHGELLGRKDGAYLRLCRDQLWQEKIGQA